MTYLELFITFLKIGAFTFGGGYAMLPMIQSEVISHGWLDAYELVDFIAVSESTPGPFAVNISTFVGMLQGESEEEAVLALAPTYLRISCIGFAASIFNSSFNSVINGIGYASLSFVIGILDGVVGRIGIALLLGRALGMGLDGYWYGQQLAGYVTAICSAAYYYTGRWKTHELLINK